MRAALLIVALFGLCALASAQATGSYTFKGTLYSDNACATSVGSFSSTYNTGSTTAAYPCSTVGSGSGAYAVAGYCYNYSIAGINFQYWNIEAYLGGTCPSSGTGYPTGTTNYNYAYGSDFSTCVQGSGTINGSFKPSSCSSASTLVVPSVLLVALAFVASKLSL